MTPLSDAVLCLADRVFIPDPYSAQTLLPTKQERKIHLAWVDTRDIYLEYLNISKRTASFICRYVKI